MRNHTLIKTLTADEAIAANLLVKAGAASGGAAVADAAADKIIGASTVIDAAAGERVDVVVDGIVEVKAGGTISMGDLITAAANGVGIVTVTAGNRVAGIAMGDAVSGDIFPLLLKQGSV